MGKLLPSKLDSNSSVADIKDAIIFYSDDLSNSEIVDEEFCRWKRKWMNSPVTDIPRTLNSTLEQCSVDSFPNIHTLLQLFATLPLSSCSCERSASTLRRLNNYLRCSQTEERLSALALIYINYETVIDVNDVCKIFFQKHSRRLESATCFSLDLYFFFY